MTRRDRRRAARRIPSADEALSRIRLRAGRELAVLDVSCSGALVEGEVRLLPGTHTDVHLLTASGRVLVRSRIVRAYVAAVSSNRIVYRGALAFEQAVDVWNPPRTCAERIEEPSLIEVEGHVPGLVMAATLGQQDLISSPRSSNAVGAPSGGSPGAEAPPRHSRMDSG